jgi:hypothetical protein
VAFSSYSTTPSLNLSIGGVSVAEGCSAANINDAIRQLMADGRALSDSVSGINVSTLMPIAGGTFTGQIKRSGGGGYFYNANATQSGGKITFLTSGSALPSSPQEGDMVFFY